MWVLHLALAAFLLAPSGAYFFEPGYSHHYTYWSQTSAFDVQNVTIVLKFQISAVNQTEHGLKLHSLSVDSLVQYSKRGLIMNNPMGWDFSKAFLFVNDAKGSVTMVHCHPEDHEELLTIKKALASLFSVHVQIEEEQDQWAYSVSENDHYGDLLHNYTAESTAKGLKLHRSHASSDPVFRYHNKTLHYDHSGTLQKANAKDTILLKNQRSETKLSNPLPGAKEINTTSSGDFPKIQATIDVAVSLDGKRPRISGSDLYHNLTAQSLQTTKKPEQLVRLETVRDNITECLQCFEKYPVQKDLNRTICVANLRRILELLHKDDYVKLVDGILGNGCYDNDSSCEDRRHIFIDVVSRIGDETSQDLILKHVVSKVKPVSEELRRVFIHCVSLEHPTERFVKAIARLCFGERGEHHGATIMKSRVQIRACLAVGSLARNSARAGRKQRANGLVDRLESWLDLHAQGYPYLSGGHVIPVKEIFNPKDDPEGDHHVSKRSTWLEDTDHENHHVSKAVLLHALGNAGLPRSRGHLLLHAKPNRGHQMWRRAALDAMRRYNCTETARAILNSLMTDDMHTVRQMALSTYVKHPRRRHASQQFENDMLSQAYTYKSVARVKRDMLDRALFKFKIELPPYDWKKELGTKDVGASFGVYFENRIDAVFKVLSGHVDVTIHDKVWAEVHIGLIDEQWDILHIEVCYKGRLSYNMNIVKDFTVGMYEDITSAFDHIVNKIVEPVENFANNIGKNYQDVSSQKPKSGFRPLAEATKKLPKVTQKALQATVDLSKVADKITGFPVVSKIKQLAARAQSLMEDVNSEAVDFFDNVKDVAVVALPFAEKEIQQSINTVMDKLGDVSEAPRQAVSFIERAKMGFQLAMGRVVKGNAFLKQATAFLSGSRSSFMNAGQELQNIAETTRQLVHRLRADHTRRKREADPFDEMGQQINSKIDKAVEDLDDKANTVIDKLSESMESSKEIQEGFDKQALYTEILKSSFEGFKEAIDMVKSRISALFGQKFHPAFPDQRRDCDDRCGCGTYPTSCYRYGHPGVELSLKTGWKVRSPVAGLLTKTENNSATIKPATSGFTDYDIILSNINFNESINSSGIFVDAGQVIGKVAGRGECSESHIALAMKRNSEDTNLCYYVDPSPFLDRLQPIPKWTQECKDFIFRHFLDTIDFDKLTEGFIEVLKKIGRELLDIGKKLLVKAIDLIPDEYLGPLKSIAKSVVQGIDSDPANLKNLFKDGVDNMKQFFGDIGTDKFSLNSVMDMAQKAAGSFGGRQLLNTANKVTGLVGQAQNLIQNPSPGGLLSLATGGISRLLSSQGISSGGAGSIVGSVLGASGQLGSAVGQMAGHFSSGNVQQGIGSAVNAFGQMAGQFSSGKVQQGIGSAVNAFGQMAGQFSSGKVQQGIGSAVNAFGQMAGQFSSGKVQQGIGSAVNAFGQMAGHFSSGKVQQGIGSAVNAFGQMAGQFSSGKVQQGIGSAVNAFGQVGSMFGKLTNPDYDIFGSRSKRRAPGSVAGSNVLVGGRAGMMMALKTSSRSACPSFGNALASARSATCFANKDCLGFKCDVSLPSAVVKGTFDVTVEAYPYQRTVKITGSGKSVYASHDGKKTLSPGLKVMGFTIKFKVITLWQGKKLWLSLAIQACSVDQCLPDEMLVRFIQLDPFGRKKRSAGAILSETMAALKTIPLDTLSKELSDLNIDADEVVGQITGIQDTISSHLQTNEDKASQEMELELKTPKDFQDAGHYPLAGEKGELHITIFVFKFCFPLGIINLDIHFGVSAVFGIKFDVKVQAIDSLMQTTLKPFVSGLVVAWLKLQIVTFTVKLQIKGYVMETSFPLLLSTNYSQQPVVTTKEFKVELVPLKVILSAHVSESIAKWKIDEVLWEWQAPTISKTIWKKVNKKEDLGPPRFPYCHKVAEKCGSKEKRQTRALRGGGGGGCFVHQVKGRHPKDTAFKLEFSVEDDDSDVQISYAVGDFSGGTNVKDWTKMRGSSLLSPASDLPCGVPLYFVVKGINSQNLTVTSTCSIPALDCTFPDGRVDAAYRCSSHPSELSARVILHDDSDFKEGRLYHALGYSPSSFGHEVVDWRPLTVQRTSPQFKARGSLRYFSSPRPGRLTSIPLESPEADDIESCASECLGSRRCLSFSHNEYNRKCELHSTLEGTNADRKPDGHFKTYERFGKSLAADLPYNYLPLRHGTRYYVNADVENVMGYRTTLTSEGTMIDMTPPEPSHTGNVISDEITGGGCSASVIQRCTNVAHSSLKHRKIITSEGSRVLFTGNRKGQHLLYTPENYHAAANWNEFKDEECGIHGYTWAVGTTVCGREISGFSDPHRNLHNKDDWPHTGLSKGLHLPDGEYFVTMQAVSDIHHGGDLVTTLCHAVPFIVDITDPFFHSVDEFLFDETFRFLVVYYNVSDDLSNISRLEFGLGRTKYDVFIRKYIQFEMRGVEGNTYFVNEEFETEDGVPAWIRLKVGNNVDLIAYGAGETPILLDSTPPIAGHVLDGEKLGQDICCQKNDTKICAQWVDFHDPDSYIESYYWAIGLTAGKDDVVAWQNFSSYTKIACVDVPLEHNVTYFSTVLAYNKALNQKSCNTSSDGVLVDITPPVPGIVADGGNVSNDVNYTSETATVITSWADFYDPESGLAYYNISVFVNDEVRKTTEDIGPASEQFTDHSFTLRHGDIVYVDLQSNNRAEGSVTLSTDGMLVDHTPPELLDIGTANRTRFQQMDDELHFVWNFFDPESGVELYRCAIWQSFHGVKSRMWPESTAYHVINPDTIPSPPQDLHLQNMPLLNGAAYHVKVTAINRAKLSASEVSFPVIIDTTPPAILKIKLAPLEEEEFVSIDMEVEHVLGEQLWVTWSPHDAQSGIKSSLLCIGVLGESNCLSSGDVQSVDGSLPFTTFFTDKGLNVSSEEGEQSRYQVYLIVVNGAGMESKIATSKPFFVVKGNIAGVVLDGRREEDADFSYDTASVAMTFSGFSSEACGIIGYEWGVGTSPFATDVIPFSASGLVVDKVGRGFAQVHVTQVEGQKYFSSVRAKTGPKCHEEYIVSSSDGFVVDTTPPSVSIYDGIRQVTSNDVVYQSQGGQLKVSWAAEDMSGVQNAQLVMESVESALEVHNVTAVSDNLNLPFINKQGATVFPELSVEDHAGNEVTFPFPSFVLDISPPSVVKVRCTDVISIITSLISCTWNTVEESQSPLSAIHIGVGSGSSVPDLVNLTSVPVHNRQWSYDTEDVLRSSDITELYVIIQATNAAELSSEMFVTVKHDVTPPTVTSVSIVTSRGRDYHDIEQVCQTSVDYIEVLIRGIIDDESDIARVELALGTSKGRSDVKPFREYATLNGVYAMGALRLTEGSTVYVTARVTNDVGLYVTATSESVVISPEPRLEVIDGPGEMDTDGQSDLHVLQGSWRYSDPCLVLSAEWSVQELGAETLPPFKPIPGNGNRFYNDSLKLQGFRTYLNVIRIQDALNRTVTAFSDGVTVFVQRPDTATVRDGLLDNDQDYQEATDRISANWDEFGNAASPLLSDRIVRYEAAVGTDRGFSQTRVDVHAFENVGLATGITFFALNLTAKTQTYFVTVRAYSASGSYSESSSDGIGVGFSGNVSAGVVEASGFQSSTSNIRFSWAGFDSDFIITHYHAGISSERPPWEKSNLECFDIFHQADTLFDVFPLKVVEAESMLEVEQVFLEHGQDYYVTVVAVDKMGRCAFAVSKPIVVDTTPPEHGNISADGVNRETVIFLHSTHTVFIDLDEFPDPESGLYSVDVQLLSSQECVLKGNSNSKVLKTASATNETRIVMRNLDLKEGIVYFLHTVVTNGAGLKTKASSKPMLVDMSPPSPGKVKLGADWRQADRVFQNQTETIKSVIALKSVYSLAECSSQVDLLSEERRHNWLSLEGNFSKECIGFDDSGLHVIVQHDSHLTTVEKGGVQFTAMPWREGDYKFRLRPATGDHIVTGLALASPSIHPPFLKQNGMVPGNNSLPCDTSLHLCRDDRNHTSGEKPLNAERDYGVGLTFMENEGRLKLLLWAEDFLELRQEWIALDFDPTTNPADYCLRLTKRAEAGNPLWEIAVLVNGIVQSSISGLSFPGPFSLRAYTWNVDGYVPPVSDPFTPFRAVTLIQSLSIPVLEKPLCSYGSPFHDTVSGIKEIWVGVSDIYNETANIVPHRLLKTFCLPCLQDCGNICSSCQDNTLSEDFTVLPLTLDKLQLLPGDEVFRNFSLMRNNSGMTLEEELDAFQVGTYYLDVRVVDHSGLQTNVKSSGFIVDSSPAVFDNIRCFDPELSKDLVIEFLGNNHTVGVTWEVTEDISDVKEGWVSLGTKPGLDDIAKKVLVNRTQHSLVFSNIAPCLQELSMYFATVEVMNEADLLSQAWVNFTVLTSPPNMSAVMLSLPNVTSVTVGDVEIGVMENTEKLELDLDIDQEGENAVEYYELAIGTGTDSQDVFPRTTVGTKNTKRVAIVDGFIQTDGLPEEVSLGDFVSKNVSGDTNPNANTFRMEPGRCLQPKLYGVSRSHVATPLDIKPICIKRPSDVLIEADGKAHTLQLNGSTLVLVPGIGTLPSFSETSADESDNQTIWFSNSTLEEESLNNRSSSPGGGDISVETPHNKSSQKSVSLDGGILFDESGDGSNENLSVPSFDDDSSPDDATGKTMPAEDKGMEDRSFRSTHPQSATTAGSTDKSLYFTDYKSTTSSVKLTDDGLSGQTRRPSPSPSPSPFNNSTLQQPSPYPTSSSLLEGTVHQDLPKPTGQPTLLFYGNQHFSPDQSTSRSTSLVAEQIPEYTLNDAQKQWTVLAETVSTVPVPRGSVDVWLDECIAKAVENLDITLTLIKGAVVAGVLTEEDLLMQYGTSASTEFSPFIVYPDAVADPTSRWLKRRLVSFPGPKLFLSPVAGAAFVEDIAVNFKVSNCAVNMRDDLELDLLLWNPDRKQWESSRELCVSDSEIYNRHAGELLGKLCQESFSKHPSHPSPRPARRLKRSSEIENFNETQDKNNQTTSVTVTTPTISSKVTNETENQTEDSTSDRSNSTLKTENSPTGQENATIDTIDQTLNETNALVATTDPFNATNETSSDPLTEDNSTLVGELQPRMVTVAVVSTPSSSQNYPPLITNAAFTLREDEESVFTITYVDMEEDEMTFSVVREARHGSADVTEGGRVTYSPELDFSGKDDIVVEGMEVLDSTLQKLGIVPNAFNFTVTFQVSKLNDPPVILYIPDKSHSHVKQSRAVGPTAGNGVNMTVYIEGNATSYVDVGQVLYGDADLNDSLVYSSFVNDNEGAEFTENDMSSFDPRLNNIYPSITAGKQISLNVSHNHSGHVTYDCRVKDTLLSFSERVTLNVFVLLNPCYHGDCKPRDCQGTCLEPRRTYTFDPYVCSCHLGYEGEWCQTETNECLTARCSVVTDCVDLIGGYRCDVNPGKMAAIVVSFVVAVALVVLVLLLRKKRKSGTKNWALSFSDNKRSALKFWPSSLRRENSSAEPDIQTYRTLSYIGTNDRASGIRDVEFADDVTHPAYPLRSFHPVSDVISSERVDGMTETALCVEDAPSEDDAHDNEVESLTSGNFAADVYSTIIKNLNSMVTTVQPDAPGEPALSVINPDTTSVSKSSKVESLEGTARPENMQGPHNAHSLKPEFADTREERPRSQGAEDSRKHTPHTNQDETSMASKELDKPEEKVPNQTELREVLADGKSSNLEDDLNMEQTDGAASIFDGAEKSGVCTGDDCGQKGCPGCDEHGTMLCTKL